MLLLLLLLCLLSSGERAPFFHGWRHVVVVVVVVVVAVFTKLWGKGALLPRLAAGCCGSVYCALWRSRLSPTVAITLLRLCLLHSVEKAIPLPRLSSHRRCKHVMETTETAFPCAQTGAVESGRSEDGGRGRKRGQGASRTLDGPRLDLPFVEEAQTPERYFFDPDAPAIMSWLRRGSEQRSRSARRAATYHAEAIFQHQLLCSRRRRLC